MYALECNSNAAYAGEQTATTLAKASVWLLEHSAQLHDLMVTQIYLQFCLKDLLLCLPAHLFAILTVVGFMTKQKLTVAQYRHIFNNQG